MSRSLVTLTTFCVLLASANLYAAESQRWALLIGVNEYAELSPLNYAGPDMQALAGQLKASGFADNRVVLMHDKSLDARHRPIRANIAREFKLMLDRVQKDDLLLVGFSGHGLWLDGKSYLCPTEAQDADPDRTLISVNGLYTQLAACPAALKILLVDACRNDPRPPGRKSAKPKDDLKNLGSVFERPPEGLVVFSSCGPGQISWEDEKLGHGVFMNFVLKGLSGEADGNRNGKVSLEELFEFASDKTEDFVATKRSDFQRPSRKGEIHGKFEFLPSGDPEELKTLKRESDDVTQAILKEGTSLGYLNRTAPSRITKWEAAARSGTAIAQYFYGRCLQEGIQAAKNPAEGLRMMQLSAEQGLALAQTNLGYCLEEGEGISKDPQAAVKWYRLAALQGIATAQTNLGYCLESGTGTPKDRAEAVKWYRLGAEQGFARAQTNLAWCLENGEGIAPDAREAVSWYQKAADQGYARAQANLGWCLENGNGAAKDPTAAVAWYRKAAAQDNAMAQNNLGWCLLKGIGTATNQAEAVPWFRRSAEQGNMRAQTSLGWCLQNGFGVARDPSAAVPWLRKAADQGFARAQGLLGECYENGTGVGRDQAEAVKWYRLSATQGDSESQKALRRLNAN